MSTETVSWDADRWFAQWPLAWFYAFGFAGKNEMPCAWNLPEHLPGMR